MRNRNKFDVIAQILRSADENGGVTQTRIMYKALLSSQQVKELTSVLMENHLLEYIPLNRYKITQKGYMFLSTYDKFKEYFGRSHDLNHHAAFDKILI
jgi:predicted transcriptional regulator